MDGKIRLKILPRRSQPKFKIKLTRDDVQDINLMIAQLRSDKKREFKGWSSHFKDFSQANCRKSTNRRTKYHLLLIYSNKNLAF
jgi:hypothetical protein